MVDKNMENNIKQPLEDKMEHDNVFWECINKLVKENEIIIDRPKGTRHPKYNDMSLFQNPVGFEPGSWKNRQKPDFSTKFKEAVPKTEVLEQP
ncbi:MAG: hypothetical protein LBG14_03150, partial [Treponema sp.]|nr:hypothetical protein [Treponema sp.]